MTPLERLRYETLERIGCADWALDFFQTHRDDAPEALTRAVVAHERMWGDALKTLPGLAEAVASNLKQMQGQGGYETLRGLIAPT